MLVERTPPAPLGEIPATSADPAEDWGLLGRAVADYLDGEPRAAVWVEREDGRREVMSAAELLRVDGFPPAEEAALEAVRGRVLDVGAGAGPHALALQAAGHEVTALELSPRLAELLRRRGVTRVVESDAFAALPEALGRFDTVLFAMNGLGVAGELARLEELLERCRPLLERGGAILADGCDLRLTDDRRELALVRQREAAGRYFGDTWHRLDYRGRRSAALPWLYVDHTTLRRAARAAGYRCQLLFRDEIGTYLARLVAS